MSEVSKSKPVRLLASVAAGSTALAGGLPLLTPDQYDWIGPAVGLLGLVITAGLAVWTEGNVVPVGNVAVRALDAPDPDTGGVQLVSEQGLPGIPNGAPVDVAPAAPTDWVP